MFHFQLVTLTGIKVDEDVSEVLLPTLDGRIGVLPEHMPLISVLSNGIISVRKSSRDPDNEMDNYAAFGGVIEIADNVLRVLADEAENGDSINEAEADKAYQLALKMKAEAKDDVSLENAQQLIDRQAVRIQVSNLHRHRKV